MRTPVSAWMTASDSAAPPPWAITASTARWRAERALLEVQAGPVRADDRLGVSAGGAQRKIGVWVEVPAAARDAGAGPWPGTSSRRSSARATVACGS